MVIGGQDQTKPGYRTWLLRKVSRGGEERSEKPWLSPVSAAVLAQTQLCCPWAGLALAAPPVSTHPTAATPESGDRAGGTVLVALLVPQEGPVPSSVTLWCTKDLMPHHPK